MRRKGWETEGGVSGKGEGGRQREELVRKEEEGDRGRS